MELVRWKVGREEVREINANESTKCGIDESTKCGNVGCLADAALSSIHQAQINMQKNLALFLNIYGVNGCLFLGTLIEKLRFMSSVV